MIRTTFLTIVATLLLSGTVNAEFLIDNFNVLDNPNDSITTPVIDRGISVEVSDSNGGLVLNPVRNQYEFSAPTVGDNFTVRYDWAGVFDDLQSISGLMLESIPANFIGDWSMTIDTGVGTFSDPGPSLDATLPSPIALDNATHLEFTFTYDGNAPAILGGVGIATFGGNPLFATPEPTGLLMMGTVGLVAFSRRRRR